MSDVNQEKSYRTGCPVLDRGCCSCRETYGGAFPAVERTGVGIELADRALGLYFTHCGNGGRPFLRFMLVGVPFVRQFG